MTVSAIIIGRNEGERLRLCLASVASAVERMIYVDSGSSDGSVAAARAAGAEVVELDMSKPFTAARARNAGLDLLRSTAPPTYVQFVDGDCELQPHWIATARTFLDAHPNVAIACGRRRERFPDTSVYNRLCDREWDTPIGRAQACGGDALARITALNEIGGFNPRLIAGEEPEMCVRLRRKGWEIWRLQSEMTLHDADITKVAQWWNRTRRGGYAAAEAMAIHGGAPERHGVQAVFSEHLLGMPLTPYMLHWSGAGGNTCPHTSPCLSGSDRQVGSKGGRKPWCMGKRVLFDDRQIRRACGSRRILGEPWARTAISTNRVQVGRWPQGGRPAPLPQNLDDSW